MKELDAIHDLVTVLAGLLLTSELNLDDMEESTYDTCAQAYAVLEAVTGVPGERLDSLVLAEWGARELSEEPRAIQARDEAQVARGN